METCYAIYKLKRFINRGFLNGPFCPVYGFGAVIIVAVLTPIKNNPFLLFAGGILLTSALEYITGFILEKAFHTKWWDYSDRAYNLKGRICLSFSILWGILSVAMLTTLHPFIHILISKLPEAAGATISWILSFFLFVDLAVTINATINLNIHLQKLNQISNEIRERIEHIKSTKIPYPVSELHKKIDALTDKYEELLNKRVLQHNRLLDAFPSIKSMHFNETLNVIKERLSILRNKDDNFKM